MSDNVHEVADVQSWIPGTDVEVALEAFGEAEQVLAEAKRRMFAAKKRIAAAMRD